MDAVTNMGDSPISTTSTNSVGATCRCMKHVTCHVLNNGRGMCTRDRECGRHILNNRIVSPHRKGPLRAWWAAHRKASGPHCVGSDWRLDDRHCCNWEDCWCRCHSGYWSRIGVEHQELGQAWYTVDGATCAPATSQTTTRWETTPLGYDGSPTRILHSSAPPLSLDSNVTLLTPRTFTRILHLPAIHTNVSSVTNGQTTMVETRTS